MRVSFSSIVERGRVVKGELASPAGAQYGAFLLRQDLSCTLKVIVGSGHGWDHVSVSLYNGKGLPGWGEMCWVKDLFFGPEECVVQYHPPRSRYVDIANVLHMWRQQDESFPMPPVIMV